MCMLITVHYTIQHRTVLTIFPLILRTIVNIQILSTAGEGEGRLPHWSCFIWYTSDRLAADECLRHSEVLRGRSLPSPPCCTKRNSPLTVNVTQFDSTRHYNFRPRTETRLTEACLWAACMPPLQSSERKIKLECGPMPNLMVALPNIGGALCSTPQSLADAHY